MKLRNKTIQKVGQLCLSEKTTATDPCYKDGTPGRLENISTVPGIYDVYILRADVVFHDESKAKSKEIIDPQRVTELRVILESTGYNPKESMEEYIGDIDVDSASAAFCRRPPNYDDHEWGEIVQGMNKNKGTLVRMDGAMAFSGLGDGCYGVYGNISKTNPDAFDALEIVFIDDESDECEPESYAEQEPQNAREEIGVAREGDNLVLFIRDDRTPLTREEAMRLYDSLKEQLSELDKSDEIPGERQKVVSIFLHRVRQSENDAWYNTLYMAIDPGVEITDSNVKEYLLERIQAYLQTPNGYNEIDNASHDYNWGDFVMSLPFSDFGLYDEAPDSFDIVKCVKLVVDQDEWLMPTDVPAELVIPREGAEDRYPCTLSFEDGAVDELGDGHDLEDFAEDLKKGTAYVSVKNPYTKAVHTFKVDEALKLCIDQEGENNE